MIPYYAQIAEPLQRRKIALLAQGRQTGRITTGNHNQRLAYTRGTHFEPTEEEKAAFRELQNVLCTKLSLHHVDPDKPLFLQIDGSLERGFGVMAFHLKDDYIWQKGTPIPATALEPVMFLSRCLTKPELRYGPSELEVACLVWACKRLRTMLHSSNHPIIVLTDHDSTRGIVAQTSLQTTSTDRANRRLVNASIYLSSYQLEVYHLPGRLNLVPDALSRLKTPSDEKTKEKDTEPTLDAVWDGYPGEVALFLTEVQMTDDMHQKFTTAYRSDTVFNGIIEDLCKTPSSGRKPHITRDNEVVVSAQKPGNPFRLDNGLLYNKDNNGKERLVIPAALIQEFLRDVHDDQHHFGKEKMMAKLEDVHFRRKQHLVDQYVAKCHACGANRQENQLPIGEMQPIQAPEEPMHTLTMDFITGLPTVPSTGTPWHYGKLEAFNALLTVTCKTSKRSLLLPGHEKYTAQDWGEVLGRHLLLGDWSCPRVIISDRDAKFTSKFWNALWKTFNTRLMMTTAYHPQSDGQSERKNQTVELAVRYHAFERPDENWLDLIPSLQWNLNNSFSAPIDTSPHEFLFGFKIPGPVDRITRGIPADVAKIRYMREHLRRDAQLAMDIAAAIAKRQYDAAHRQVEFAEGDKVWLTLGKAYKPKGSQNRKEMPRRQGPYLIKRKVTKLAYELDLPNDVNIHPVISIQYLTAYNCDEDPFQRQPPPPGPVEYGSGDEHSEGDGEVYEVERIVDHRRHRGRDQYLVRWKGYGPQDDQWKAASELTHSQRLLDEFHERNRRIQAIQAIQPTDGKAVKRGRGRPRKS